MGTIQEIQQGNTGLLVSDIKLYKQEIQFLLKIITRQYASSMNRKEIKLLDTYWIEFEECRSKLELMEEELMSPESLSGVLSKNSLDNHTISTELQRITVSLKGMKSSLYTYLENPELVLK